MRLVVVVKGFNNTKNTTQEVPVLYKEWSECVVWGPDGCNSDSASANWRQVIMCDDKFHLGWKPIITALIKAVAVVAVTVCHRFPFNPKGVGGSHLLSFCQSHVEHMRATWISLHVNTHKHTCFYCVSPLYLEFFVNVTILSTFMSKGPGDMSGSILVASNVLHWMDPPKSYKDQQALWLILCFCPVLFTVSSCSRVVGFFFTLGPVQMQRDSFVFVWKSDVSITLLTNVT